MGINYARKNPEYVTVCFVMIKKMRNKSIGQWNKRIRGRIRQVTYQQIPKSMGGSIRVHLSEINKKEKIGELVLDRFGYNKNIIGYSVRLYGHAKTVTHCKPKTLAIVKLRQDSEGNDAIASVELGRFVRRFRWFMKDK